MKCVALRNFEWAYPDVTDYKTAKEIAEFSAFSGGYAAFQIFITGAAGEAAVEGDCDIFEEIAIPVEKTIPFANDVTGEHFPERQAPFRVYDCLKPYSGKITPEEGNACIYVRIFTEKEGIVNGTVTVKDSRETVRIPYKITVIGKKPEETLKSVMNFGIHSVAKYHRTKDPAEIEKLETEYMKILRYCHQTRIFINMSHTYRKIGDFADFDRQVEKALSLGFTSFQVGGIGFRRSWDSDEILIMGTDYREESAQKFLKEYLTSLRRHLTEKGWMKEGMFSIGIADEPNDKNAESYTELCRQVKKLFPEIKLYDAVSEAPIADDALDIWIPRADLYEKNMETFERRRNMGGELWQYICLFPREIGYVNRFMDIPLISTRYVFWGNYKYSLTGYLHWTINDYQSDIDPFKASCPMHINADSVCILPPGDDKLVYPGDGKPWMSARLENTREGIEEYEMLRCIAEKDKEKADTLCEKVFKAFNNVEFDPCVFAGVREELLKEYGEI